ncbi:hypothetical protein [Sulfurimonas sp. HSL3-7]|uniref:hypothetical protein n=1 Tax=Sulfonitrofixus jiaomeiensis TaxID=3131938 RepID=UPI0031F7D6A6
MKTVIALLLGFALLQAGVLEIGGSVEKPLRIDSGAFSAMKQTELEKVGLVCMSGETKAAPKRRKGVLLRTLFEASGLKVSRRGDRNRAVVLASGRDGYSVAFSYQELVNTPVGERVLVVDEDGMFGLYTEQDYITGPRHVRNLVRLEAVILDSGISNQKDTNEK